MKKYPHGLTLNAVCAAIDDYQRHEDSVPEEGILAAFNTLLGHSDIAEAFRALEKNLAEVRQYNLEYAQREVELEQRAETAEAKLAELANQPPVAYTDAEELDTMQKGTYADMFKPCDEYKSDPQWIPLFTRPAPAADLVKQQPRYQIQKKPSYGRESLWIDVASREEAENNVIHGYRWRMVYDAPAPAADLAELVPGSIEPEDVPDILDPTANPDEYA